MRKITVIGLIWLCTFQIGCSKKEIAASQSDEITNKENIRGFYQLPSDIPPPIRRIAEVLQQQDKKHPFSVSLGASGNFPAWAKYEAYINGTGRINTNGTADTTILIPLANYEKRQITSFFACLLTKDTVLINFYQGNSYDLYPYKLSNDTLSANTIAIQMMAMHSNVFGDSVFNLLDARLLPFVAKNKIDGRKRYIKIRPAKSNASKIEQINIRTCYDIDYDGDEGQLIGTAPGEMNNYGYTTKTICVVSSIYINVGDVDYGDGVTNPTSGGSGGGGSGNAPCGPTENGRAAKTINPGDCGGDLGWEPNTNGDTYRKDEHGYYYARRDELSYILEQLPEALLPCDSLNILPLDDVGAYGLMYKRVAQYTPPQYVKKRIDSLKLVVPTPWYSSLNLQSLENATGPIVNCDFFPVRIQQLPTNVPIQDLLEYFRKNLNTFIDSSTGTSFTPYISGSFNDTQRFNADKEASLGALVHINIGLDNGSIIETDYYTDLTPSREKVRFKFSTIKTPIDGLHPVSGNREFGIYAAPSRPGEYTFYTMGVDRTTDWIVSLGNISQFGFKQADKIWGSVQKNMINYINTHGGQASEYPAIKARPKWNDVSDYLKGLIDFKTLKQRLGCF